MKRVCLIIEYRGTAFAGWQCQPNKRTVQQTIEEALYTVIGTRVRLHASGRTDAGVHAVGQVAHFDDPSDVPPDKWSYALNYLLAPDVSIVRSYQVDAAFHARGSAKVKTYAYHWMTGAQKRATMWDLCDCTASALDVSAMEQAARHVIGTHDFSAFMSSGSSATTTVRTVTACAVTAAPDAVVDDEGRVSSGGIVMTVSANGFLYNMVRIIAAQLKKVGERRVAPTRFEEILRSCDRTQAKEIAPPQGLYLLKVIYDKDEDGNS